MCTFGVLGLSCEPPAAPGPPGFAKFWAVRRRSGPENCGGRVKKSAKFWASHPSGPPPPPTHPSGPPPLRGPHTLRGPHPSVPPHFGASTLRGSGSKGSPQVEGWLGQRRKHQFWPKSAWPKSATQNLAKVGQNFLAKVGQIGMAKVGLAKVGSPPASIQVASSAAQEVSRCSEGTTNRPPRWTLAQQRCRSRHQDGRGTCESGEIAEGPRRWEISEPPKSMPSRLL